MKEFFGTLSCAPWCVELRTAQIVGELVSSGKSFLVWALNLMNELSFLYMRVGRSSVTKLPPKYLVEFEK